MLLTIIFWLIFGLVVGVVAKFIHPGDEPVGWIKTLLIGVVGSFVGGAINWLLSGASSSLIQPSGFIMSVIGGVITCVAWRYYNLKFASDGPRSFISGKKK